MKNSLGWNLFDDQAFPGPRLLLAPLPPILLHIKKDEMRSQNVGPGGIYVPLFILGKVKLNYFLHLVTFCSLITLFTGN